MKGHYYFNTTLVAGGSTQVLKQMNLLPTLADFNELTNQAQFYQQYKFLRINYSLRIVNQALGVAGTRLPTGSTQPLVGLSDVFKVRL